MRKEQEREGEKQLIEKPNAKTYPPCPHCQSANLTEDICLNGPNAATRPKGYELGNP